MDREVSTENLVFLRMEAGYSSAKDFARALGISYSTYARWERGDAKAGMTLNAAWQIADALGCTIDEIIGRTRPYPGKHQDLSLFFSSLSPLSKALFNEFRRYLELRDYAFKSEKENVRYWLMASQATLDASEATSKRDMRGRT